MTSICDAPLTRKLQPGFWENLFWPWLRFFEISFTDVNLGDAPLTRKIYFGAKILPLLAMLGF